jgi:hypothetical protein
VSDKTLRQDVIDEFDFDPSFDSANSGAAVRGALRGTSTLHAAFRNSRYGRCENAVGATAQNGAESRCSP